MRLNKKEIKMANISNDSLVLQLASVVLPLGGYVSTPRLDLHATSFTVATKVFLDTTDNRNILLGNWSSNQNAWQLLFAINAGGRAAINLRKDLPTNGSDPTQDLVALVGSLPLVSKHWHHVAITFSWGSGYISPTATLYVDGKEAGTVSPEIKPDPRVHNPYTLKPSANAYLIGHKEDGTGKDEWFSGQLRDFRIYTVALTANDITQLL
jgi:hypothetical protein